MSKSAHSRILLKLSGEVLAGKQAYGIDPIKASNLANEIKSAHDMGTTIILVIGAGNIFLAYLMKFVKDVLKSYNGF